MILNCGYSRKDQAAIGKSMSTSACHAIIYALPVCRFWVSFPAFGRHSSPLPTDEAAPQIKACSFAS
ncbi:unnamed protein product [Caenorhabditis auriculariae]|uniref:Uncharacterized protein n=1 Tax=Caenorhabditis auriculariae TaxID=2777116 RepID=A0A8S1H567_9PELO|nr:unnamed protein product [Caenorhabditis auriculariae]